MGGLPKRPSHSAIPIRDLVVAGGCDGRAMELLALRSHKSCLWQTDGLSFPPLNSVALPQCNTQSEAGWQRPAPPSCPHTHQMLGKEVWMCPLERASVAAGKGSDGPGQLPSCLRSAAHFLLGFSGGGHGTPTFEDFPEGTQEITRVTGELSFPQAGGSGVKPFSTRPLHSLLPGVLELKRSSRPSGSSQWAPLVLVLFPGT